MPTVTQVYHVQRGSAVVLNAAIGDGQTGGHAAYLGTTLVAAGQNVLDGVLLGDGGAILGRVLVVSSTAVDIRPEHDRVSVLVQLSGGFPSPLPIVQAEIVPAGGAQNFLTVVQFVGAGQ